MADRDKVIKGLECCSQMVGECCRECPYADECEEGEGLLAGSAHLAADALALLKAQEPVKPHRNYQYLSDYWCECGWHLGKVGDVKFCSNCGHAVKWPEPPKEET